ncbi:MAG: DinB family protein [Gemmatimonadales bacterium]|jgi:uncharacterized damage-inducible protein DinB
MTLATLLLPEFDHEMASTRRLLERVPDGKSAWTPHTRSMPLGRLATHVAETPGWATNALTKDELDIAPPGAPPPGGRVLTTRAEILALFDRNAAEARIALADALDDEFEKPWTFKMTGKTFWTRPKYEVYRIFSLNHMIHHRAQLGHYLRLLHIPIPGMYGPSADERAG